MLRPRLILLAAYGGAHEGTFIPMVRSLADAASKLGWDTELGFSPGAERHPWYEALREDSPGSVYVVPEGGRRQTARWLEHRLATDVQPTILHTHFTRYDLAAAWVGRRGDRTAVLWHLHTPAPAPGLGAMLRRRIKFGLVGRRVDGILAAGSDPARIAISSGAPRELVEVVDGGIAVASFTPPSAQERDRLRRSLSISDGTTVLLHFGWDWDYKGGDLFLGTVGELRERAARGDILGITLRGGEAASEAVRRGGLEGAVRVLEPVDDVRSVFGAADLFISSSRIEGQPFAVIEAICSGLPVLATELPGHHDICDGLGSCRVTESSAEAMATGAIELLDRPAIVAKEEAAAARRAIAARFELGRWTERMIGRYETVLGIAGGGRPDSRPGT